MFLVSKIMVLFFELHWVDIQVVAVQYTFTHKQYTEYRERNIHNNKKNCKCGPFLVFVSYTLAFTLQLKKKHGKPQLVKSKSAPISRWQ
jgi:hypothetical protein